LINMHRLLRSDPFRGHLRHPRATGKRIL
jgi:hypothetical protein